MRRRRQVRYVIQSSIPRDDLRAIRVADDDDYDWLNFIIDISLFLLTGGLWSIWIFVREMRRR